MASAKDVSASLPGCLASKRFEAQAFETVQHGNDAPLKKPLTRDEFAKVKEEIETALGIGKGKQKSSFAFLEENPAVDETKSHTDAVDETVSPAVDETKSHTDVIDSNLPAQHQTPPSAVSSSKSTVDNLSKITVDNPPKITVENPTKSTLASSADTDKKTKFTKVFKEKTRAKMLRSERPSDVRSVEITNLGDVVLESDAKQGWPLR